MSRLKEESINIRGIREEDGEAYLIMLKQIDSETKNMMYEPGERKTTLIEMKRYIVDMLENNSFIAVAENEGTLVGFIAAERGFANRIKHSVYIFMGVLAEYRGQGIGKRLFGEFEKWATKNKIVRAELTVMTHNKNALGLYESMGFQIEGEKPKSMKVDGVFIDEYYMGRIFKEEEKI